MIAMTAEMMHVQGVVITPIDVMMTIARMVEARCVVALTVLRHPLWTPHVKSAKSMATLPRTAGGDTRMMMMGTVATRVARVQTLHPMELIQTGT
jgi:hypothetical protein